MCSGRIARVFVLFVLAFLSACGTSPPVQEMSDARQAIAVARDAGASELAPAELRAAEDFLDSALRNLSKKAYKQARLDAVEAKNKALIALATAGKSGQISPQP